MGGQNRKNSKSGFLWPPNEHNSLLRQVGKNCLSLTIQYGKTAEPILTFKYVIRREILYPFFGKSEIFRRTHGSETVTNSYNSYLGRLTSIKIISSLCIFIGQQKSNLPGVNTLNSWPF